MLMVLQWSVFRVGIWTKPSLAEMDGWKCYKVLRQEGEGATHLARDETGMSRLQCNAPPSSLLVHLMHCNNKLLLTCTIQIAFPSAFVSSHLSRILFIWISSAATHYLRGVLLIRIHPDFAILHIGLLSTKTCNLYVNSLQVSLDNKTTTTNNFKDGKMFSTSRPDPTTLRLYKLGKKYFTSGCGKWDSFSLDILGALAMYFYPWCHDQTMRPPPWSTRSLFCTFSPLKMCKFCKV